MKKSTLTVDERELATILAALRLRQKDLRRRNGEFVSIMNEDQIATDGWRIDALGVKAIDRLCERLNCTAKAK